MKSIRPRSKTKVLVHQSNANLDEKFFLVRLLNSKAQKLETMNARDISRNETSFNFGP